nr:MAG TPA: hypothetical protein [Bacteriophage sp.]
MGNVYNPGKRVNSRVGERTLVKGKVTWFWDSLMNQDHVTVRIAKHQDVMGNKPNPLLTHTGKGSGGIELLRGFLTRDITFSATNEWGEAKDSIKDTVASQTGIDTGALGNDNGWVESAVRGLGGMAKSFFEMVGMDKTAENIDNAMREELKALSYKLVNYAEAAKTYQGTAVNFPNTLSVLLIADKYGKDPRAAIHNVLGDFLGVPVASLTKEIENTAVKQLAVNGSLKADTDWPQGAKDYWDVVMEERKLQAQIETHKANIQYFEDPTNVYRQRQQALDGGNPDQNATEKLKIEKQQLAEVEAKLAGVQTKKKNTKVSAGDVKIVEAKLNVSIKGEKTGDNVTTDGVANSIAGKVLDLIGTTKNLLTQGNWEFMGPPGGYLYDPEATRNNKSHPGTISLFISNHMVVHNLLVSNVDIDVSQFVTVEGYPLWVRADISFVPAALFTSRDIARSLGGSGRIYGLWDESLANADASNKGGTKQYLSNFKAVRLWEVEPNVRRDGHNEKDENQRFANLGFDPKGKKEGVFSNWSVKKNPDNQNYRVVIVNEEKERVNKEISKAETKLKNDSKGYNIDSSQNSATFKAALDRSSDVTKNAMEAINSAQRSNQGFKSLNQNQMKGFMDKFELKRTALEAPLYNFLGQKQN